MAYETPTSLLRPLVDDLAERRATAQLGGGQEKIDKQHAQDDALQQCWDGA